MGYLDLLTLVQSTSHNLSCSVKLQVDQQPSQVWLEYAYRKHHPALQWLPTKLAEWIANNLQDELGFPDKADPRRGWTPAELNSILQNHVVRNRQVPLEGFPRISQVMQVFMILILAYPGICKL